MELIVTGYRIKLVLREFHLLNTIEHFNKYCPKV